MSNWARQTIDTLEGGEVRRRTGLPVCRPRGKRVGLAAVESSPIEVPVNSAVR
jgi:hypothetical protein